MLKLEPNILTKWGMTKPIATKADNEDHWLETRQGLLTASVVAQWCGWSPYELGAPVTRFSRNYRNVIVGELLEDDVLEELQKKHPGWLIKHNADGHLYQYPDSMALAATPDAVAWRGTDYPAATIQVKTTTASWGGKPPPWVQLQAAVEAYVMGADEYCVAWYEADIMKFLTFHARWFNASEPVDLIGGHSISVEEAVNEAHGRWFDQTQSFEAEDEPFEELDDERLKAVAVYKKYKRLAKRLADREKMAKKRLELLFPEDGEWYNAVGEVVLKKETRTSLRFDSRGFKASDPDEYEKHRKETNLVFFQT